METEDLKTICKQHGVNPEIVIEKIKKLKKLKNDNKVIIPFWTDLGDDALSFDYVAVNYLDENIADALPVERYSDLELLWKNKKAGD